MHATQLVNRSARLGKAYLKVKCSMCTAIRKLALLLSSLMFMFICLPVCLFACLLVCLFLCLFTYLFVAFFFV